MVHGDVMVMKIVWMDQMKMDVVSYQSCCTHTGPVAGVNRCLIINDGNCSVICDVMILIMSYTIGDKNYFHYCTLLT